jgi:hypothetical protein
MHGRALSERGVSLIAVKYLSRKQKSALQLGVCSLPGLAPLRTRKNQERLRRAPKTCTAINKKRLPGDKARVLGSEKRNRRGDLRRRRKLTHWNLGEIPGFTFAAKWIVGWCGETTLEKLAWRRGAFRAAE